MKVLLLDCLRKVSSMVSSLNRQNKDMSFPLKRRLVGFMLIWATLVGPVAVAGGAGGSDLRAVVGDQQVELPGGGQVALASLIGTRPLILHFFSTSCRVCRADDLLVRQQGFAYADRGVAVVNVYVNTTPTQLLAYRRAGTIGVAELMDPRGRLARQTGMRAASQVLFVSATGVVRSTLTGPMTQQAVLQNLRDLLSY